MLRRNKLFRRWLGFFLLAISIALLIVLALESSTVDEPISTNDTTTELAAAPASSLNDDEPKFLYPWQPYLFSEATAPEVSLPAPTRAGQQVSGPSPSTDEPAISTIEGLDHLTGREPHHWGEFVPGVRSTLPTDAPQIALTLDACGGDYDAELITFLQQEEIPATLFVSGIWLRRHPGRVQELAADPLFEIANHGHRHLPCSVNGREALGIQGTGSLAEAYEEIEENARHIASLTGIRPHFYRSGTAHYDEICVELAEALHHKVVGFDILGDAGASYTAAQVHRALLNAQPGSIVVLHMNRPQSGTAQGVRRAVPELRELGISFVNLSAFEFTPPDR